MVIVPHALTGAALGRRRHPALALALGVLSHYALDQVPHRDYDLDEQPYLVPVELAALAAAARPLDLLEPGAVSGAVGGLLPDVLAILRPESLLGRLNHQLHPDFRHIGREGWLVQVAWTAAVVVWLRRR